MPRRSRSRRPVRGAAIQMLWLVWGVVGAGLLLGLGEGLAWVAAGLQGTDWRRPVAIPSPQFPTPPLCRAGSDSVSLCARGGDGVAGQTRTTAFRLNPQQPRVVVVGESFVHGMRLPEVQALPAALSQALQGRAEVLNWGVCGVSSAGLWPYFSQAGKVGADVALLVMGNNEYTMAPYYTGWAAQRPLLAYDMAEFLSRFQLVGLLGASVGPQLAHTDESFEGHPMEAVLADLHRRPARNLEQFWMETADPDLTGTIEDLKRLEERFFRSRLRGMLAEASSQGVRVVLATPPQLLFQPPTLSGRRSASREELGPLLQTLADHRVALEGGRAEAIGASVDAARGVLDLEPEHAMAHWSLGIAFLHQGQTEAGLGHLHLASEYDLVPDAAPPIHGIIQEEADRHGLPMVDLQAVVDADALGAERWFLDRNHINADGAQVMGAALAPVVAEALVGG